LQSLCLDVELIKTGDKKPAMSAGPSRGDGRGDGYAERMATLERGPKTRSGGVVMDAD
jgi:hypothetical protein